MRLFCDCKTDEEKSNFFLSGMAVETGVIAPAISNDVAMAYHRCAQFKKENDELRAKIKAREQQAPVAWLHETRRDSDVVTNAVKHAWGKAVVGVRRAYSIPLYRAPGAQPAPSIPEISDDLIEVIESRAEQSYRRHHGGIRGQQVTPADALSWHIIHATRDVLATAAQEAKP